MRSFWPATATSTDALAALDELDEAEAAKLPFDLGWTLLARGRLNRRARQRRAAADDLQQALQVFERLGAPDWVEQARSELERVGLRRAPKELTSTELRVAELAATGLTNREVAAKAFMSPKTVEANLARVYRKLGIHSRAELGARIAGAAPPSRRRGNRPTPAGWPRILFTDLVASTEKARALGDAAWSALLDDHNKAMRAELARFSGEEIDTAGDGVFAVFDGPARAVQCALAISDAMKPLGLEVRSGVHTGEVERTADKPRGIAIATCARIMALADAGEVLVSATTRELVAGSGLEFDDRGEHELKGIEGARQPLRGQAAVVARDKRRETPDFAWSRALVRSSAWHIEQARRSGRRTSSSTTGPDRRPTSSGSGPAGSARARPSWQREGKDVRYVSSAIVPTDEALLCVIEAATEGLVRETYARAGIPFERLSAVIPEGANGWALPVTAVSAHARSRSVKTFGAVVGNRDNPA